MVAGFETTFAVQGIAVLVATSVGLEVAGPLATYEPKLVPPLLEAAGVLVKFVGLAAISAGWKVAAQVVPAGVAAPNWYDISSRLAL